MQNVTRTQLTMFLIEQGYNPNALKILTFKELKRIAILTIALSWGEIELTDIK